MIRHPQGHVVVRDLYRVELKEFGRNIHFAASVTVKTSFHDLHLRDPFLFLFLSPISRIIADITSDLISLFHFIRSYRDDNLY